MSTRCFQPQPHGEHEWYIDGDPFWCEGTKPGMVITTPAGWCAPSAATYDLAALPEELDLPALLRGPTAPRRFRLVRHEDVSGVSGVGIVAHGVEFPDGNVAVRWCCPELPPSTAVWDSIEAVMAVHGHGGKTELEWID